MAITKFRDVYDFLSSFYVSDVLYDGILYRSSESAYQAQKTLDIEERKFFANRSADASKFEGRQLDIREDWEDVKLKYMYEIVKAKFTQNESLKRMLLNTKYETLIEINWWHDNFYGNCNCIKCQNEFGHNHLGEILMKVRSEIRKSEKDKPRILGIDLASDQWGRGLYQCTSIKKEK
jgi:ribA/ribD-fused uncharacterized protein